MNFDKLVHQPTRLQLFAHLYAHGEVSFNDLREALDVTEGNLSSHLGRMEDAGAVEVKKEFVDKKPRTTYRLTTRAANCSRNTSRRSKRSSTASTPEQRTANACDP